ncbi:MAG: PEGA domain-containing protein [Cystobacter sp.]
MKIDNIGRVNLSHAAMTLQSQRFMKLSALSLSLVLGAGCASTTIIRSTPQGANVYIDGSKVGKTPYTYSDTKIVGSSTRVRLALEGFEDFETVISRSEEFQVGPCIGGAFLLVPWLWIMGYNPERNYELQPESPRRGRSAEHTSSSVESAPGVL